MVKTKTLTNIEIFNVAQALMENIKEDMHLPVKVNFYIQKNMKILIEMAQELEKARLEIFDHYGTKDEENDQYRFTEDVVDTVNKEVQDLFMLEQEVKINIIPLEWFDDIDLTAGQVSAISIMIEEEE